MRIRTFGKLLIFEVFDAKYGGHSQWIGTLLGNYFDYLSLSIGFHEYFGYSHMFYDGYNHNINLLFVGIGWSGFPWVKKNHYIGFYPFGEPKYGKKK